jgi:hypothetical protein
MRERTPLVTNQYGFSDPNIPFDAINKLPDGGTIGVEAPDVIHVTIFIPDIGADVEWHMTQKRSRDARVRGTYHEITLRRQEGRCDDYPH